MSGDSIKAQKNLCTKQEFPFMLISDPEKSTIRSYEAIGLKKMYGKEYEGIFRISYLIDEKGIIVTKSLVGNYCTSLEMQGASITVLKCDEEILKHWDAPVHTPAMRWGM